MKKTIFILIAIITITSGYTQKVSGNLHFKKGQKIDIGSNVQSTISQEAAGQTVEFKIDGTVSHIYEVLDANSSQATLDHRTKRIVLNIDAMGQLQNFDSDKKEDMEGQLGMKISDILKETYQMTINKNGKVIHVKTNESKDSTAAETADMISNLIKRIKLALEPPEEGDASFFKVLPGKELSKGDSWSDTSDIQGGKEFGDYTIEDITKSEIIIDYTSVSKTSETNQIMSMEATSTMDNKTIGKIIIDKTSGIMKKKTAEIESTGTVNVMNQSVPLNTKTSMVVEVKF